ncbi:MAG: hypothetical protein EOO38_20275 [Cytophagaceae bacterium]|nr:MAG: hypothetical protein EOO38_20275 [Cytophagaceae bacterium]
MKFAHYAATRYALGESGFTTGINGMIDMYTNLHVGPGDLIAILIQAALGLYLLLGARGLVRGLANFKNVGRDADLEKAL